MNIAGIIKEQGGYSVKDNGIGGGGDMNPRTQNNILQEENSEKRGEANPGCDHDGESINI